MIRTEVVNEDSKEEWNRFVNSNPQSRFCHLWEYSDVVENAYGLKRLNLVAKKNDRVVAVLPTMTVRSIFFGKKTVSQPFSEYGGILTDSLTGCDYKNVIDSFVKLLKVNGVKNVEMHGNIGINQSAEAAFVNKNPYKYAVLKLDKTPDALRSKVFDRQIRKAINKAERNGLESFDSSTENIIKREFYPLLLKSMKRLGVPPHNLDYFLQLKKKYKENMRIFWTVCNGKIVTGLLGMCCADRVQIISIVSIPEYWDMRTNDYVHWKFIEWAAKANYKYFDFGSVRYEGQLRYKKKWGAKIEDCGYYFFDDNKDSGSTYSSSSDAMNKMSAIWKKKVPLSITAALGPFLRKHLVR